jgi:MscS family membrane protein
MVQRGDMETGSILLLTQRITKALVVVVVFLIALSLLGFEMKGFLAGLGIGGIAVALAAQKTLENVFGGIWVLSDRAIRVGDFCVFGAQKGTVEDIGLRSTRVRTLDRTVVTIPNGQLANMIVENFTLRDKFWFNPALSLRYETTGEQLQAVLQGVRQLLGDHPKIEKETVRVRFQRLGNSSLEIEVHAYVLTSDLAEFTSIREELLVGIKEIVASSGTDFAFPSQTLYLAKDPKTEPRQ